MTGLTVRLVGDDGAVLCGRPVADWLADTVAALDTAGAPLTLVLPVSVPLVLPATLNRAVRRLREVPAAGVMVELASSAPWWADPTAVDPLDGAPGGSGAVPGPFAVPGRLAADDVAAARLRLAEPGRYVHVERASPIESLCLLDPVERATAETALYQRIAAGWLRQGVSIEDIASTRIDAQVRIAPGVHIAARTELVGETVIGAGSRIGPNTTIRASRIGANCVISYSVCQSVEIGDDANVGPFCWLRSGTQLGDRTRAGAFVEVADSTIGADSSIPHIAGLVSADVGRGVNIAGLSGPANFDGVRKHRIRIDDNVSIGAGNILVAPLSIGAGAQTAAGSVITADVPAGALAVARSQQRNFADSATHRRTDEPARPT